MNFRTLLFFSKKTVASGVAALAFLMASQTAFADSNFSQKERNKNEVALETTKGEKDFVPDRKTLGKSDSTGPSTIYSLQKKAESVKKLDAQIVDLQKLYSRTDQYDPQRAEILFNLAEAYWEKASAYNQQYYEKQDECYDLADKGDKEGEKYCKLTMKDIKAESDRLREQAISMYNNIIKDFPNFSQLDAVYFYLGSSLKELGKQDDAMKVFRQLKTSASNSRYAANVDLAIGDELFENGEFDAALDTYDSIPKSNDLYPYAVYKIAWVNRARGKYELAIDDFHDVLKLSKKSNASNASALYDQTLKDIVSTYSLFAKPEVAIKELRATTKDWVPLVERLAVLYSDNAKYAESNIVYAYLIAQDQKSWKIVEYQYEIANNTLSEKLFQKQGAEEITKLCRMVVLIDKGSKKDDPDYLKLRKKVEDFVRRYTTLYHRSAQTTKDPEQYKAAVKLYYYYLQAFPKSPDLYTMTFFFAELLYRNHVWDKAAEMYQKALELDPHGKYTNEAVHGLVLAYFKLIPIDDDQKDLAASADKMMDAATNSDDSKKKGLPPVPKPKDIPANIQALIDACQLYIKLNPKGDEIADVKYTMARKLYDFDHLKEAIPIFKDIAYSYPKNPLAVIAANLQLDSLNLLHDYTGLEEAVDEYLAKRPIKDEEFYEQLQALSASIIFMKCTLFEEKEEWGEAARCYKTFAFKFQDGEHIDKALYNAALNFERAKDLPQAVGARLKIVTEIPKSPLAEKSLYFMASNLHAIANYELASKYYEQYVNTYKNSKDKEISKKVKDSLVNASIFRQGLGNNKDKEGRENYDKAQEDYKLYLKLYEKDDPQKAADVFFQKAKIYQLQNDPEAAYKQYKAYIKKYGKKGSPDHLLEANTEIGLYLWDQFLTAWKNNNKGAWKIQNQALKQFQATIKLYDRMPKNVKEELKAGADAVSQCQFKIAEAAYETMAKIKLESKSESELKKKFKEKNDAALKARALFEKVLDYKRPEWGIAALFRIGNAYEDFANALRKSTVPKRLTYDQKEIYRGILEDFATQIETNAIQAYEKALEVAQRSSWFNEYSEKSEKAMSQLRPQDYQTPSEKRARPGYFAPGLESAKFIKRVEDDQRLEDLQIKSKDESSANTANTENK